MFERKKDIITKRSVILSNSKQTKHSGISLWLLVSCHFCIFLALSENLPCLLKIFFTDRNSSVWAKISRKIP